MVTGQLVALVISSPRTAGQLVAKMKKFVPYKCMPRWVSMNKTDTRLALLKRHK